MMVHRPLYDIFVILIFVATGKLHCYRVSIYMLFAGWEVRVVKNCDRGLENAARGRKPRAEFSISSPRSQFFTIRTDRIRYRYRIRYRARLEKNNFS